MNHVNKLSVVVFMMGALLLANSFYMKLKSQLAQSLIASSWQSQMVDQPASKPWPWADTYAIAKIEVPRLHLTLYVMNDDSGESLAFGPGHMPQTSLPASTGHSMIAGHRDSHFDFIQHLHNGDEIIVSNYLGKRQIFKVSNAYPMDTRTESLNYLPDEDILTLVTCYPFEALTTGGPLRWVVDAYPIKNT